MRYFMMFLMLVSISVFAIGCQKPAEEGTTDGGAATGAADGAGTTEGATTEEGGTTEEGATTETGTTEEPAPGPAGGTGDEPPATPPAGG